MTHTVELIADHKGFTKPRVNGDEYMVDAAIDITAYTPLGENILASSLGLSTLSAVIITGAENNAVNGYSIVCEAATGKYPLVDVNGVDTVAFTLAGYVLASGAEVTGNIGTVRVRAFGNL